jgi:hypothetical protein
MTDKPLSEEAIHEACKPKSDRLNFEDFQNAPRIYTVIKATEGDSEAPIFVYLEGEPRPYKPCKTMIRVLKAAWGTKASDWIGKRLELYGDPTVKWAGVEVGGIRISKVSGIDKPLDLMLTINRGKRSTRRVEPLPTEPTKSEPAKEPAKHDPLPPFRSWLESKGLSETDAQERIGGRTLEEATDEDWKALRAWAKELKLKENEQ